MGACASSQQEHPGLHGTDVRKDDIALKCKVRRKVLTSCTKKSYSLADVHCAFTFGMQ